jgi:hypothetical protein
VGSCLDEKGGGSEETATVGKDVFEFVERFEGTVGDGLIDEGPETLGRLDLGRVRWLVDQVQSLGHPHVVRDMETGAVEDDHDSFGGTRTAFPGEVLQDQRECLRADRRHEVPLGIARTGAYEGVDIQPLVSRTLQRRGTFPSGRPYATDDRLQAEPVLVLRPELDFGRGMLLLDLFEGFRKSFFLKSSWACGSASA